MAVAATVTLRVSVKASWDIQPRQYPIPDPQNQHSSKNKNPNSVRPPILRTTQATSPATLLTALKDSTTSELLNHKNRNPTEGKYEGSYMGYERWLPVPPKVKNPRSVHNAASLAYIGDCIYEFYARRHFLFPPLKIEEYNNRVMAVVRCEAQDALLKKLLNEPYLSEEERDILRWGKNIGSGKTRTTKRAGVAVYNRASSLETLVGYLYLTNVKRLEELMLKLGFSTGASNQLLLDETQNEATGFNSYKSTTPCMDKARTFTGKRLFVVKHMGTRRTKNLDMAVIKSQVEYVANPSISKDKEACVHC